MANPPVLRAPDEEEAKQRFIFVITKGATDAICQASKGEKEPQASVPRSDQTRRGGGRGEA